MKKCKCARFNSNVLIAMGSTSVFSVVGAAWQWFMTKPYLLNTYFCSFLGHGHIFRWGRKWGGGGAGQMFLDFLKSRLHGLSNDDTTIFTEHPFFVILGPRINFWAGQEQKEAGQLFLSFRNLLSMASPKVCDKTIFNEHSVLVMLRSRTNFWARQKGRVKLVLVLKHSLIGGKLLYPVWRHKLE